MALRDSKSVVILVVAALLMVALAVVSIGGAQAYDGPVDAAGNSTSFDSVPQTIVSSAPSITETLIAMGYSSKIIGVSDNCDAPEIMEMESQNSITRVGSYANPSQETMLSLDADVLFIGSYDQNTDATYNNLRNAEAKVVMLYGGESLSEIYLNIDIIGQVMNDFSNAQAVKQNMIQTFNEVQTLAAEATSKPKAMINLGFAWGMANVYGAGINTFAHDMLTIANSTNVLSRASGWVEVNWELIMEDDTAPEVILVMVQDGAIINETIYDEKLQSLKNDERWGTTPAVMNEKVYFFYGLAANVGQRPSPNLADFSKLVLMFTHPELFGDLTLPGQIGDGYKDFIESNWD
ncbi:MAG: ABC transporter substrate-binding protein [Candidatus Methanomethylophilaceae archaeon]